MGENQKRSSHVGLNRRTSDVFGLRSERMMLLRKREDGREKTDGGERKEGEREERREKGESVLIYFCFSGNQLA